MGSPEVRKFAVRMPRDTYEKLKFYSSRTELSMNRVLALALEQYLNAQLGVMERDLLRALERVKAYAASPKQLDADLAEWVQAEMSERDPLEGLARKGDALEKGEAEVAVEQLLTDAQLG
jgi:predicted DNA-binding protein